MKNALLRSLALVCLLLGIANAQAYLDQTGFPNFTTSIPVEGGMIDTANGNLHIEITLGDFPQRGKIGKTPRLVYDSRMWNIFDNGTSKVWSATSKKTGGWRLVEGSLLTPVFDMTANTVWVSCGSTQYLQKTDFVWADGNGTRHHFPINWHGTDCTGTSSGPQDAFADDGSGYHLYVDTFGAMAGLYTPDGTSYFSPGAIDTNGNSQNPSSADNTDTSGRKPFIPPVACNYGCNPAAGNYQVLTSAGTYSNYVVTNTSTTIATAFGVSGVTEYSGSMPLITKLTRPDGSYFSFGYDAYGQITSLRLPTGSTTTFTYTNFTDSYGNKNRWITGKTNTNGSWSFTPAVVTTCAVGAQGCQQKVTVSKPNGELVVYTFTLNGGAWPVQAQYYNSSSTLQLTTTRDYDFAQTCTGCVGAAYVRLLRETNNIPSVSGSVSSKVEYAYDNPQYGNVTSVKQWKYYSGTAPAAPDRERTTTYLATTPYLNAHIINKPTSVIIKDGAGTQVAKTIYVYDSTALTGLACCVPNWSNSYDTTITTRGNVTSIQKWVAGTTYLTTTLYYDVTGQVIKSVDPAGNQTTFDYTNNFYDDNGTNSPSVHTTSEANAAVTSITRPLIGTQSIAYYFGSGKPAFTTDSNGARSYSHFADALDRATSTTGPTGAWTLTTYPSTTEVDNYAGTSDTTAATTCTGCVKSQLLTDGFGRTTQASTLNDPDGATQVVTTYDSLGRVASVTNPYRSTTEATYGITSYSYDALGRKTQITKADSNLVSNAFGAAAASGAQLCSATTYGTGYPSLIADENGRQRRLWKDGLGQVIEVDEPTSSGALSTATCYKLDPLGRVTQVNQQGQTRSFVLDGLGRITTKTEPEAGTTSYTYTTSTGSLCSGEPSNPCTRTDAKNVKTTYSYDAAGRLKTKSFSDGSTPMVTLAYDETSVWGHTLQNTTGRLSHESSGGIERIYSYDAAGRVLEQYECFPSNCGTTGISSYHTTFTYDASGHLLTLTYPSGRKVTYTYSAIGRPTGVKMTAAGGTALTYDYASGLTYNALGALQHQTFGNSTTRLSDDYSYNKRGQLTQLVTASSVLTAANHQYTFEDATRHNTGDVLSIVDQLNSARTQSFTYDKLDRLSTAVETAWGLSYTYDTVGNLLAQTVTSGSAPSLSLSVNTKNQITNTGFSYDLNGNLTADGTNTYQWDAENRLKTLNTTGAAYTFDSHGLRVLKTVGALTTESIRTQRILLAQHSSTNWSDWTDYVYIGGQLIAKSDNFENRLHIHGTNCSACGAQYSVFSFPSAAGYSGYVIRSGDKLFLRQLQSIGARGGMILNFTDSTNTSWGITDQDSQQVNNDGTQGTWHYRRIDLSTHAGKSLSQVNLVAESTTAAGAWDIYYTDISLVSADGTVRPIYNRQTAATLTASGSSGVTGRLSEVQHVSSELALPSQTSVFFHADHLNSARLTTNENGYPIWQSTYLPFGYEYNPQAKTTDIKFAGYERDAESDLDYAFARSYSFRHARFTSVDPVAGSVIDPQTLNRYSYARNNPLRVVDPTGAWSLGGFLADFGSDFQDGGGGGGGCCDDYGDWGGWGIDGYDGDDPYFYDANGDLVYGTDYTFQVSAAQPDNGECNAFCQAIFSDPIWGNASDFVNDVGMAETYVIGGFFGGELLGSGDLLTLGDLGGDEAAAGTFPDEFFSSKAPWQVEPGVETLEGQYIDDVGNVEPWRAHYDEFGRQIGRTDFNAGDPTQGIPDIHYHTYEYGPGYGPQGAETGSHIPGIFPEP